YPDLTDNSRAGKSGTIVSFHHGERRRRYGTEPVVVPTPPGRSRVDVPHGACLVAWSSNSHAPDVPQATHTPTQTLHRAQTVHGIYPQTTLRCVSARSRCVSHGPRLAPSGDAFYPGAPTHGRHLWAFLSGSGLFLSRLARP